MAQLPHASGYLLISTFLSTLDQSPLRGAGASSTSGKSVHAARSCAHMKAASCGKCQKPGHLRAGLRASWRLSWRLGMREGETRQRLTDAAKHPSEGLSEPHASSNFPGGRHPNPTRIATRVQIHTSDMHNGNSILGACLRCLLHN